MKSILSGLEAAVMGMVAIRLISGMIELTAAALMFKFNSIEKAVAINALLAVVGPIVLISTMTVGLIGMADKLSFGKLLLIGAGVALILIGLKK
ncbi:YqhV family protein [Bacillus alkalicellulosilyticus]|uniref:YqhV family protein n=1 Tax=Alkalihalobacterium alkalicellulosilyticum TaxID=1912214 RepID=UPI00148243BD|nr:YqhV family protein [Bacillus alkalicellulosilyticus]